MKLIVLGMLIILALLRSLLRPTLNITVSGHIVNIVVWYLLRDIVTFTALWLYDNWLTKRDTWKD